ncbi:glutamate--cysteine ligase [Beggiatoa leptomitoformis]|uniref:Glutamate--cysteine ligase n=1 Tax=Beggiatoa leptomitoformis TaxID=288004 RepID=A0A2N9YJ03_9GAMM|nr:glutamate--cysteine ligase [Beggiatoa leptomitoformis]ALG69310.1 glutamate--cysteine ligase [Beggiatoa leptomitoformis]AUI70502.1 glutamate--cysteine ligase [Beggiatoa leptomitoformis]
MYALLENHLSAFTNQHHQHLFNQSSVGLEKESLRVTADGRIAQTPHPSSLGAALTHPYITTDYSEALLEFITPPDINLQTPLNFLNYIQSFVYQHLHQEILWTNSMPCVLAGEASIPIAQYGSSNAGRMKTVYRNGLGYRYGRVMQVIAGIHFNYSFSENIWGFLHTLEGEKRTRRAVQNDYYFRVIRNLQRYGWLIPFLFGASPAVCKSFLSGRKTTLPEFDKHTYYKPFATSLRMSDIGYQNRKEGKTGVKVVYDSLDSYVCSLSRAIETPSPDYAKIGVVVAGEYRQLNSNILQIENEYYSTVRPKQPPTFLEKPIHALQRRGVDYIELRSLDINPFEPLGMTQEQIYFLHIFMLFCLLQDSPNIDEHEKQAINLNFMTVTHRGRDPQLLLRRGDENILLRDWATEILVQMQQIACIIDAQQTAPIYNPILNTYREMVHHPDLTPSARVLAEMHDHKEGFHEFAKRYSLKHADYYRQLSIDAEKTQFFQQLAEKSLTEQTRLEAQPQAPFDTFLQTYFNQSL